MGIIKKIVQWIEWSSIAFKVVVLISLWERSHMGVIKAFYKYLYKYEEWAALAKIDLQDWWEVTYLDFLAFSVQAHGQILCANTSARICSGKWFSGALGCRM